jgi:hypothetical protein
MRFVLFLASLGGGYSRLKSSLTHLRAELVDSFFRQIALG